MSLFWKIFGWFWLSQIMVICATFWYLSAYPPNPNIRHKPGPPPLWAFFDWQRMLIFMGIGTIVSYALARYLASPAMKLRRATHQFAEGDLSTRVGPQMGRRRDELADMGHDFDLMAERIETLVASERRLAESERRTVEAQQRLLADISHELRSPLARIAYALDLAKGSADEQTGSYLKRIERESGRLNELIGQLLTLARLEATAEQNNSLESAALVNLSHLVEEVCHDADFEARAKGREVHVTANDECFVRGSAELLRSAVENVVRNAVRHTPQGTAVEVVLSHESGHAFVTVRDCGAGVPEESLSQIFQPFYRVSTARERESGGAGLGLSITDRAVRFHGGTASAENAAEGGLLVRLSLPTTPAKTQTSTTV